MACWLEPHWRSMVVPGTDSGNPAARAALRPTFAACSPTCITHPAITSSINAVSSLFRCARPFNAYPSRSTGCQFLSIPSRLPIGVRTASIITASRVMRTTRLSLCCRALFFVEIGEGLACFRQPLEQRRGLPEFSVLAVKFADAIIDLLQAYCVGIKHRATAMGGEAIAVDINNVDVDRAQRITFFQDARAFVDQRVKTAVHHFFRRNLTLGNEGARILE